MKKLEAFLKNLARRIDEALDFDCQCRACKEYIAKAKGEPDGR